MPKNSTHGISTHMPSVIEIEGKAYMLFCSSHNFRQWRSFAVPLDGGEAQRINFFPTGHSSECSPDGYVDESGVLNLSITCDYQLNAYRGPSFRELWQVRSYGDCLAGTVLPTHVVIARHNNDYVEWLTPGGQTMHTVKYDQLGFQWSTSRITRISFLYEDPDVLIITGMAQTNPRTTLYRQSTRQCWEVRTAGQPVYKSAIYKGVLYYAVRASEIFEDRYLVATHDFTITPVGARDGHL